MQQHKLKQYNKDIIYPNKQFEFSYISYIANIYIVIYR